MVTLKRHVRQWLAGGDPPLPADQEITYRLPGGGVVTQTMAGLLEEFGDRLLEDFLEGEVGQEAVDASRRRGSPNDPIRDGI